MRNAKTLTTSNGGFFIMSQKVIVYVDGFNFYYGLKQAAIKDPKWKKFYWLDMVAFFEKMLSSDQELVKVNYFSARPHATKPAQHQESFFSANRINPKFKLILGKYLKKDLLCHSCGSTIHSYEEKETDVRIATQIINDAYKNECDVSIIVSADSDIIPAIELVRDLNPSHKIFVYFPPFRHSVSMSNLCDSVKKLSEYKARFNQSMLSDEITLHNGTIISRPENWK